MLELCEKTNCCGCTACKNICPRNAISMIEDENGFRYPKINNVACINCGLCKNICPIMKTNEHDLSMPSSYAAYNQNEDIRIQSSSGGLFTLIASEIINRNGIVFGAAFDENFFVVHEKAETIEELKKFRGSKYIQSDLKNVFKDAKRFLEQDRYVLFTGTPCQVEGFKSYLKKDYAKLYTQDLICHGVPSKKVWEKYLNHRTENRGDSIQEISFRNKKIKGWSKYQVSITYKNSKEYFDHSEDLFMKIFLSDIALRESCYNCKFKKKHKISDITLADFWGINNILPEMNDEKGTSLIIVNSDKGKELFDLVKKDIVFKEVEFENAIKYNSAMIASAKRNCNRDEFFRKLDSSDLEELVNKYITS